jgi:hypothetical protein
MKRITSLIAILAIIFVAVPAGYITEVKPPIVPMEVFSKGRAETTRYLVLKTDQMELKITGQSVVTTSDRDTIWVSKWDLDQMGYRFDGSFENLSRVIATRKFNVRIIPLDDGSFDVRVDVKLFDNTGAALLIGSGYISINHGPDGLVASECELYVSIPEKISLSVPGEASSGKWVSGNWNDQSQDFWGGVYRENGFSVFQGVPMSIVGRGYFAFQPWNGPLKLVDLANGGYANSDQILVIMGKSRSPDIMVVGEKWPSFQFNKIGDRIYGRYPLLEVPATNYDGMVDFSVPVWGTETSVSPVSVKVIGLTDRVETVVQPDEKTGLWPIKLGSGQGHQIIVNFGDLIQDWPDGMG